MQSSFNKIVVAAFVISVLSYLLLFGYNTVTRTKDFGDPDTMNFVDIARNIANGQGISQSALGFNQAKFSPDDKIPMPLTAQPPLYPLAIALISFIGISFSDAGLLISIISYGLILFISYRIAVVLFDLRSAVLSVAFLMLYYPLYRVAKTTFSDPFSIVFLLLFILMMIKIPGHKEDKIGISFNAGFIGGLGFATRYALLPVLPLGIVYLFYFSKRKIRHCAWFLLGFIIPAGMVLGHNYIRTGEIMPGRNPSTVSLIRNIFNVIEVITKEYSNLAKADSQGMVFGIILVLMVILLAARRRLLSTIGDIFLKKHNIFLTLWVFTYLGYLVYARTTVHLDPINWRLILPGAIILVVLFGGILIKSLEIKDTYIYIFALMIGIFVIKQEARITAVYPLYDQKKIIAKSERLSWVENNTSDKDLIIGNGSVDLAFYFARPALISFSPFPEADVVEYEKIIAFCNKHCEKYKNIYLIIHPVDYLVSRAPNMKETNKNYPKDIMKRAYGPFITDILYGDLEKYPEITILTKLEDAHIFKIHCAL